MPNTFNWPLLAIHESGHTILLNSPADVHAHRRIHGAWHDKHRQSAIWFGYEAHVTHSAWIVRDDCGQTVTEADFNAAYPLRRRDFWEKRRARAKMAAAKGLPIPGTGCSKAGWKMNHMAKKNSGAGHRNRNRNRARAIYEACEYGVPNKVGSHVIPWEGC